MVQPKLLLFGGAIQEAGAVKSNKIKKGAMTLLDPEASAQLYAKLRTISQPQLISGGSAANTAVGVVAFGGTANFVGRVRDDDLGSAFRDDIVAAGVGLVTY